MAETESETAGEIGDAMEVAPDVHEVVLENDRVRVLRYTSEPGDRAELHTHPDNVVIHCGSPAKMAFGDADGATREIDIPTGYVGFSEAAAHTFEHLDGEATEGYIIELRG